MNINLSEVLSIYTSDDVNKFLKKYTGFTLEEKNLSYSKLENYFTPVGNNINNNSTISILKDPDKGLIERITNGIDAVLENQKIINNIQNPKTPDDIIKIAFPNFYKNKKEVINKEKDRHNAVETSEFISVFINDGSKPYVADHVYSPTIDIIDKGTGIEANKFENTILSLQKGNKTSSEKTYLIGTFGQGGSTSLSFSKATLIISKKNNKYAFTIIKPCDLNEIKMESFLYLNPNEKIIELTNDSNKILNNIKLNYLNKFINSESGTLIRMIDYNVKREYFDNDVTKPTELIDYINTEIFKSPMPIYLKDFRTKFKDNEKQQGRNAFGNFYHIITSKSHYKKEFSGTLEFEYENKYCKIPYYIILPSNEEDWGKETVCRKKYKEFNIHEKPIIYTSNGQYISGTDFTKLKNKGLPHLQYKLLVEVDLDMFDKDKYKMITATRDNLKESNYTNNFKNKLIEEIAKQENLKLLDQIICDKTIRTKIDREIIENIENKYKKNYQKFLHLGKPKKDTHSGVSIGGPQKETKKYDEEIKNLKITTKNNKEFYKDNIVNIHLETNASKKINETEKIYAFFKNIDDTNSKIKDYTSDATINSLEGRIQYSFNNIKPGKYQLYFALFKNNMSIESNKIEITIKNENDPNEEENIKNQTSSLNLKINEVQDKELIVDFIKNTDKGEITILICFNHPILVNDVFYNTKPENLKQEQQNMIEALVGFVLGLDDYYETLSTENKNKIMSSLCLSLKLNEIN